VMVDEQAEGARYRLLETIRQYAQEKLFESHEAELVRDRHLDFFIHFAEAAEPKLRGAEQLEWLERVETEHGNLRTALRWSLESGKSEAALRLANAAYWFWSIRGYWSEGQRWLDEALELDEQAQSAGMASVDKYRPTSAEIVQRAKALYGAAMLRFSASGLSEAARLKIEESLRLWRTLDNKWWLALALKDLGQVNYTAGDISTAQAQCEESVELARQIEDRWVLAATLSRLGRVLHDADVRAAQPITEEAVAVAREVGDKNVLSYALVNLVVIYFLQGDYRAITPLAEEALGAARAVGSKLNVVYGLAAVGLAELIQGNRVQATDKFMQLLVFTREMGSSIAMAYPLLGFGATAVVSGQPQRAVKLFGVIESLLRNFGIEVNTWSGGTGALYRKFLQSARAQLDEKTFNVAMLEGRALSLEQAIAFATEDASEDSPLPKDGLGPNSEA
jgi:tetratricopeptide (TPR) repeat protein